MEWETQIINCPDGIARLVSLPSWFFQAKKLLIAKDVIEEEHLIWEIFDTAILQAGEKPQRKVEAEFRNWFAIWIYELWIRAKNK